MDMNFVRSKTDVHPRLFVEHGDLFDLENGFDGIAAFVPCGLTCFRHECERFIRRDPLGIVMTLDENPTNKIFDVRDVEPKVFAAMNMLVSKGVTRIGMNGIRTTGASEQTIVFACDKWLRLHNTSHPNVTITLVDRRNSFRHWARRCAQV